MALTIGQIAAVSYDAVLADNRKAANQWNESAFMRAMEKLGMIDRRSLGATIEAPLDYRRNPGSDFLATDLTPVSLSKTEVMTAASFEIAELSIPVVWSKGDDAKNPSENQKIAFVKALLENGINSHDDMIEEALFAASDTDGFHTLNTLVPTSGQGTVGGIDASTETFWRNPADTYLADGSDFESVLDENWMTSAKGSGASTVPKLLVSGDTALALFNSTQQAFQRFTGVELDAGFKTTAFKTAPWVYSQYGDDNVFGLNPRVFKLVVSKQYFRDKGETRELDDANGFVFKIYSALQAVTNNKSRLFVVAEA